MSDEKSRKKLCQSCEGPLWEKVLGRGIAPHDEGDCIAYLKERVKHCRAETMRELDKKYNKICEVRIRSAVEHLEKRRRELEEINEMNAESIRRGRAKNVKLQTVVTATVYCLRHGYIDQAGVIFTGLDEALEALETKTEPIQ
jgi:hypothetical protein